jgi:hypothetical protein
MTSRARIAAEKVERAARRTSTDTLDEAAQI